MAKGGGKKVQMYRGRGVTVTRSTRNANARNRLLQVKGRGTGGAFTTRQLREAIANNGRAGRKRRL